MIALALHALRLQTARTAYYLYHPHTHLALTPLVSCIIFSMVHTLSTSQIFT